MDECHHPPEVNETIYQIKIQGRLDERWSDWFNGMSMTTDGDFTLLTGVVADQSKLRGILSKVWDLNLQVVSVTQVEPSSSWASSGRAIGDSYKTNQEVDNG